MSKTAEEFVFKKYGTTKTSNDGKLVSKILPALTNSQWYELMEAYHTAKLEEVEGLPSDDGIENKYPVQAYNELNEMFVHKLRSGAKWMRSIAQSVIAKKDADNKKHLCPHCESVEVEKEGYACERCCVRGTNTGHEFKLD